MYLHEACEEGARAQAPPAANMCIEMCESNLTRRQLLRQAALLAATVPSLSLVAQGHSFAAAASATRRRSAQGAGVPVPMHLELVTVTDTEAVVTWFTCDPTDLDEFGRPRPLDAPGRVLIGTNPDMRTWQEVGAHGPTPFHYVNVTGLSAGTTYYWRAESNGVPATPTIIFNGDPVDTLVAPPVFTTLVPPPGRELGKVAWFNDLHFAEKVAGLAISNPNLPRGGLPPGFPVDPDHPYWRFMSRNAVAEAKARGMTLLLANGDLTNEAEPAGLEECRSTLDVFGTIGGAAARISPGRADLRPGDAPAYFVTRGNHDRAHEGDTWESCSPIGQGDLRDCFADVFTSSWEPGSTHFSVTLGDDAARYRFVGLDSNDGSATGVLRPGELDYLEQELQRGDITIPLFHHPASDLAGASQVPPFGGLVADAEAFRAVVGRHDNVGGVYAGHTHRNNRSLATGTGEVPFFEGGAVKEYPGGYTQVRLFEGGYMVNFFKTAAPDAQAWAETTRGEYLGLGPMYQLGGFGDRNWVHHVDARRTIHADEQAPLAGSPAGGRNKGVLPATGGGNQLAAAAAAAASAAALHRLGRIAHRHPHDHPHPH